MIRKNIDQILRENQIDINAEYQRLHQLFYLYYTLGNRIRTLYRFCNDHFLEIPFRNTCLNVDDLNITLYNCNFAKITSIINISELLNFCEFTFNLLNNSAWRTGMYGQNSYQDIRNLYFLQINQVIDKIGYFFYKNKNNMFILVSKDQPSISVAEAIDDDLSYKFIEYNHYTMKGDIEQKKTILLRLASKLEPQRNELKQINKSLEDNLFFLFNNINLRHDNITPGNRNYKEIIAKMDKNNLENLYDETYQLCLLAFLELDNVERIHKIDDLKKIINP